MPETIGLIPAAGRGTRLGRGSGSKELVPVPGRGGSRPVIEILLDGLARADVQNAWVVAREGKEDLGAYLAARSADARPRITCRWTPGTDSVAATLAVALPELGHTNVVMGFPDVCFEPPTAVAELLSMRRNGSCDIDLALFPSDRPDKTDMVEVAGDRVTGFRIKPGPCELTHTWIIAAWGPRFTEYLPSWLSSEDAAKSSAEIQISQVLAAALEDGFTIGARCITGGRFVDIGTPDDLARVRERSA